VRAQLAEDRVGDLAGGAAALKCLPNVQGIDWKNGKVWKLNLKKKDAKPELYPRTFQASADIGLSKDGKFLLVPDMKAGTLVWLPK